MEYTQKGVLAVQVRVTDRLRLLLAQRNMTLDPGSPMWFGGRPELPKPDERWQLALSAHGKTAVTEFTPAELDHFMAGRAPDFVSRRLGQLLDTLRP